MFYLRKKKVKKKKSKIAISSDDEFESNDEDSPWKPVFLKKAGENDKDEPWSPANMNTKNGNCKSNSKCRAKQMKRSNKDAHSGGSDKDLAVSSSSGSGIKRLRKSNDSDCISLIPASGDIWNKQIPPELLLRIFQYVVVSEGALPFLCR